MAQSVVTGMRQRHAMPYLGDVVLADLGEYKGSMLKSVRLNREILEAWAEHGKEAGG